MPTSRRPVLTAALVLLASLTTASAAGRAPRTADGPCAAYDGAAFRACHGYCERRDCPTLGGPGCNRLRRKFLRCTGGALPPCEAPAPPPSDGGEAPRCDAAARGTCTPPPATCGNGVLDADEACDGDLFRDGCPGPAGTPFCRTDCTLDTSGCCDAVAPDLTGSWSGAFFGGWTGTWTATFSTTGGQLGGIAFLDVPGLFVTQVAVEGAVTCDRFSASLGPPASPLGWFEGTVEEVCGRLCASGTWSFLGEGSWSGCRDTP
jgi:hypothetical protein